VRRHESEDAARILRELGRRLRALREQRGLSQMTLGLSAGVHPTYISGIERGLRNPTALNLVALAHALGVRPGELLPDDL